MDTSSLETQLSVLSGNLRQAESVKQRLEVQIDSMDVSTPHYEKKVNDLEKRLETQYDKKYEIEESISDLKAQIRELKKDQVDADSIYEFLFAFREVYSGCNEAEKKQFMQAFIDRIDIFPERREDGNWIRNIRFNFPVPIIREGKETIQVKGITLEKESIEEGIIPLEKLTTVETVVLLSRT